MTAKKILVVTPRFPFPVIGGDRLRIYNLCKELAKSNELTLISLCESQDELNAPLPNDGVFSHVHRVLLPKWRSYLNCLMALFSHTPLQVAYYQDKEFSRQVTSLLQTHQAALAHLVRTAPYLVNASQTTTLLEYTDAISMNYARVRQTGSKLNIKHWIYCLEYHRLKRYESYVASKFSASVFVAQADADYLFSRDIQTQRNVMVCSNGVDLEKFENVFSQSSLQLIFIGNLYSAQNFDAALWFAQEVLPELRKRGDFTFKVIGKIRDKDKLKLAKLDGVVVTGLVDSVLHEAKDSLAGICSVRLGAGVQNKVLEYMAMGLPCISSSVGLEGFDLKPNESVIQANEVGDYIDAILKLHSNFAFATTVAQEGHEYVKKAHSWSAQLAPISDFFAS